MRTAIDHEGVTRLSEDEFSETTSKGISAAVDMAGSLVRRCVFKVGFCEISAGFGTGEEEPVWVVGSGCEAGWRRGGRGRQEVRGQQGSRDGRVCRVWAWCVMFESAG